MSIPDDFKALFPKLATEPDTSPIYYLWVFDPEKVPHPERIHGYAYRINDGWRITDWEHRPVGDPHVKELVRKELRGEADGSRKGSQVQARALR
jgi:hypothetical protein